MILSVSRRTDIPAFYSDWFMNRIKDGYVLVRNPFNSNQISRVKITPDVVDCIVFWSKDPLPLMKRLHELKSYNYYFQFTITPYDNDIEVNLKSKKEITDTFIELSKLIGKEKVILRYDPILITDKYTLNYHIRCFERLCDRIGEYTERVIISFLDDYKKVSRNMKHINLKEMTNADMFYIASEFSKIAYNHNIDIQTCAEAIDLDEFGIKHGRCIDGDLIERITGYKFKNLKKDGSRQSCLCHQCIDIGQYDTCTHGCLYCYANVNKDLADKNKSIHKVESPILSGEYNEENIRERKDCKSLKLLREGEQIGLRI